MSVTPSKASKFCKLCYHLLMDISFEKFEDNVDEIQSEFPKCTVWLGWYLDPKRLPHLFRACDRSFSNPLTKDRYNSLCKVTNAQEGFGHLLK